MNKIIPSTKLRYILLVLLVILTLCCYQRAYNLGWQKGYYKAWADYEKGFEDGSRYADPNDYSGVGVGVSIFDCNFEGIDPNGLIKWEGM